MNTKLSLVLIGSLISSPAWAQAATGSENVRDNRNTQSSQGITPPAGSAVGQPQNALEASLPASQTMTQLSDAQVVGVLMATNKGEVDLAKLAVKQSQNKDVIAFAEKMIKDHGKYIQDTQSASKGVKPAASPIREKLETSAGEFKKNLSKLKGTEFDQGYIGSQVALHQEVLRTIDSALLPSVRGEELRELIENTRPSIAQHFDHATQIQRKLGSKAGPQLSGGR